MVHIEKWKYVLRIDIASRGIGMLEGSSSKEAEGLILEGNIWLTQRIM